MGEVVSLSLSPDTLESIRRYAIAASVRWRIPDYVDDIEGDAILEAHKALASFDPSRSSDPQKRARILASFACRRSAKREAKRRQAFRSNFWNDDENRRHHAY